MVNFETVYLSVPKEEAATHISERVSHIRRTRTKGGYEFHTNVGIHLATLTDVTYNSGGSESKLRYRTSYIRPHLFHAHNKAREIRNAVERFRTSRIRR